MSTSPLQLTPVLVESQIQRISETARGLVKALPANFEPNAKQLNKKKLSKDLEVKNWAFLFKLAMAKNNYAYLNLDNLTSPFLASSNFALDNLSCPYLS